MVLFAVFDSTFNVVLQVQVVDTSVLLFSAHYIKAGKLNSVSLLKSLIMSGGKLKSKFKYSTLPGVFEDVFHRYTTVWVHRPKSKAKDRLFRYKSQYTYPGHWRQFPVRIVRRHLRKFDYDSSPCAVKFLTVVLEKLVRKILRRAVFAARSEAGNVGNPEQKVVNVYPLHIQHVIRSDIELSELFKNSHY